MLKRYPALCPDVIAILDSYSQGVGKVTGPIHGLTEALSMMGWSMTSSLTFERAGMPALDILDGPNSWWFHQIRDGLRACEWTRAAARRHDMAGLHDTAGMDRDNTCAELNSRSISPFQRGCLRSIISGSVRLGERLFQAGLWNTPLCIFCGHENESVEHCFWRCPAWDSLRMDPDLPRGVELHELPSCTKQCGIFMYTREEHHFVQALRCGFHVPSTPRPVSGQYVGAEFAHAGRVVCWTDGACSNNQYRHLRRGGCGVFYAVGHPSNKAYPLPGVEQTNQRAELHAIISAIESEPRFLEVRTDSKYVCDGFQAIRQDKLRVHSSGDNADLWSVLASTVAAREADSVIVTKVKGHAKDHHVASGQVLAVDKWGNDHADTLAVEGRKEHEPPQHLVDAFIGRRAASKATHMMMRQILEARQKAEAMLGFSTGEKHEEECENPWEMDVPVFVPHPRSGEG